MATDAQPLGNEALTDEQMTALMAQSKGANSSAPLTDEQMSQAMAQPNSRGQAPNDYGEGAIWGGASHAIAGDDDEYPLFGDQANYTTIAPDPVDKNLYRPEFGGQAPFGYDELVNYQKEHQGGHFVGEWPFQPDLRETYTLGDIGNWMLTGNILGPGPDRTLAAGNEPVGFVENVIAGTNIGAAHVASNALSLAVSLGEASGRGWNYEPGADNSFSIGQVRQEKYRELYNIMTKALDASNLAEPRDFADSFFRAASEGATEMGLETLPLSMATAGIVNPAFAGLATKFPTLAAKIAPIVHDAVTFAAQGALEPDQPGEQAKWGAITGATLGAMAPYGRIARAVVGAGLGAGQEYAQNPQASVQDIEKNATLMATFGALSRAEGMNLSDTFYGTLWDWAQNKGILPDAFRRSLQMQGVGPIANQFADEMGSHPDLQAAQTSQVPTFLRQNAERINQFFMGRVPSLETLEQMGPQGMQTMADDLGFKSVDELKQWVPAMREVWEGSKGVRNDEANPAPSVAALIDYARKAGPQAAQLIAEDHGFSSFDEMVGAHQSAGIGEIAQNAAEPESSEDRTGTAPTRVDTDSSPSMEELTARFKPVTPDEFITQRDKSTKQPFLTPYTAEEMQGWQHFLTDDGAGFAITPDRDIVGVFNNSGKSGAGADAVTLAIAKGGKTLDCVEGYLDTYYNSFGFVETSRVPWDDNLAPKGWDYETYGKRPIVFFEFPDDFSRSPADTRRRFEIARSDGGPWRTGLLWDISRWNSEIARLKGEGLGDQTPQGPRGGNEDGGKPLAQPAEQINATSKDNEADELQPPPIVLMHSIGPDTSEVTQAVADKLATFARPGALRSIWRRMEDILTLDPVPRMARISNFLADKAVEHASARIAAPKMVDNLLSSVFPDQYRDPEAMSKTVDILNKDNVLAGYDEFNRRANEAWSEAQSIISSSHDAARQEIYDHYVKAKEAETKGRYDLVAHWLDKAEALEAAYDKATGDTEATGTGRGKERAALREYFEWKNKAAAIGETLNKSAPEYAEYDRARGAHEEARAKQLEDARKDAEQAVEDARRDNNSDAYLAAQKKLERIEGGKLKSNNEVAALISGYRAELEEARRTGDTKAGTLAERRLAELAKNELAPDRNISSLETAMEEARNKTPKSHDLEQYERDIQAAKKDPVISANIERWKKYVNPYLDQLYNEMKGLDPAAEQEGRGKYFGARINLTTLDRAAELSKSLGDPTKPMPEPAIGSSYRNPNVKRDPFDRAAKFTGQYSTDARLALLNAVGGRWNEVTKLRLYNGLVQSGAALPFGSERPETIQGQKATELRVKVPHTDVDENGRPVGKTVYREEPLHVRADLAREVRNVLNTDMPSPANRLAQVLTHLQLAQFLDMFAHGQNLLSVLTRAQGAGSVWADVVRKIPVLGRLDGIKRIWDVSREVQSDSPAIRDEIAQMARQGLIRPEYPPDWLQKMTHGQQFIHAIDMGSRIVMNRFFDNLVERGLAQDTEANRRGYVNQVGMYNRRLMGPLMRLSRDLGLSPFVVAGRNFNLQGIRALTGNPVVTATNAGAAMQMRLMNLMGTALTASIVPMILNSIRTGHPMGRPGTPIGAWDLGLPNNEKGQHSVIDLLGWIGARRGMRATGLDALVEGLRAGHSADQIEHEAISQLEDTWSHPWMGPAPSFLYKALTGKQLDLRGRMEATQYPGEYKKQAFENSRAALKSQNALLYSVLRPLFQEYGLDTDDKTPYYQGIHQTFLKSPLAFAAVREMYPPRSAATVMALAKSGHAFDGYREGDQAKAELKQQIRVLERDGKPIPAELQEQEQALSRGAQKGLERSGHQTELETAFGYLHRGEDILSVLRLATPDELQKLQPEALNKFDRLYNGAAPADRGKIEQEHGEAMKLFGSL